MGALICSSHVFTEDSNIPQLRGGGKSVAKAKDPCLFFLNGITGAQEKIIFQSLVQLWWYAWKTKSHQGLTGAILHQFLNI